MLSLPGKNDKVKGDSGGDLRFSKGRFGRPEKSTKTSKPLLNGKQMLSAVKLNFEIHRGKASSTRLKRTGGIRSRAPKAATIIPRDIKKKFGNRRSYTLEQLLSIRANPKCKIFPAGMEEVLGVLEEGIGDETGLHLQFTLEVAPQDHNRPKINTKAIREKMKLAAEEAKTAKKNETKTNAKKDSENNKKTGKSTSIRPASTNNSQSALKPVAKETKKPVVKKTKKKPQFTNVSAGDLGGPIEALTKSNNRWRRNTKKTREQEILGKIRSILNKITLERFDSLSSLLIEKISTEVETANQLAVVVSEIFQKTITESHFGPLYAKLCSELCDLQFQDTQNGGFVSFKNALVVQCQKEFEKVLKPVETTGITDEDALKKVIHAAKNAALGTVEFIGELYKAELIPDGICKVCLVQLVSGNPTDVQIECAYRLLLTIGKKYDSTDSGKKHLNQIFNSLKQSTSNEILQHRTRILIDIVSNIRKNGWPSQNSEKPKTLEEIHADFAAASGGRGVPSLRGGQPTFDEMLTDATNREAKLLKFALSGGCAIRNPQSAQIMGDAMDSGLTAALPDFVNSLLLDSSQIIEDVQVTSGTGYTRSSATGLGDFTGADLMDEEERAKLKESNTFVRDYFSELKDDTKKDGALKKFIFTIRRMGWPVKMDLVFSFFECTLDNVEEGHSLGVALLALLQNGYLTKADLIAGMNDYGEFYTSYEMDVPFLNEFFAAITLKLFQQNFITVEDANMALKKDVGIDQRSKKPFGRRADFLAFIIRADPTITHNPADFIVEDKKDQVEEWRAHYKL